jgi:phospholipid transport system substrate-binding protein
MMKKISLGLLCACGLLLLAVPPMAHAQNDTVENIRQMLSERDQEIKEILGDDSDLTDAERTRLQKVVNENIDFGHMGRQALGPHWEKLSEHERNRFLDTFTQIIREQSLSNVKIYRAQMSYDAISVEENTAHVKTVASTENMKTPVAYDLVRKNGEWKVVDIIIDGVGTVESYARSFQTVIRKRGFDALMKSLEKKLAEMQSNA